MAKTGTTPRTKSYSDLALYQRAIKNNWPIKDEMKGTVVETLMQALQSPNDNVKLSAAATLERAVANDRRFELEVLKILQRDHEAHLERGGSTLEFTEDEDGKPTVTLETAHRLLDKIHGMTNGEESESQEDE